MEAAPAKPSDEATQTKAVMASNKTTHVFGSLNAVLSEMFSRTVAGALQKEVATLPAVGDNDALLERLQQAYSKMVDLFEMYNRRNIFNVENVHPTSIREAAVRLYLDTPDVRTLLADTTTHSSTSPVSPSNLNYEDEDFNSSAAVNPEDLEILQAEIQQLQLQKETLRQTHCLLQTELKQVAAATQLGMQAAESLEDSVRSNPAEVWNCSKALESTIEQAEQCCERMAKRRKENHRPDRNEIVTAPGKKHRRRRALKDRLPSNHCNTDAESVSELQGEL